MLIARNHCILFVRTEGLAGGDAVWSDEGAFNPLDNDGQVFRSVIIFAYVLGQGGNIFTMSERAHGTSTTNGSSVCPA